MVAKPLDIQNHGLASVLKGFFYRITIHRSPLNAGQ